MILLAPGDSWANGAELVEQEAPFGPLLAEKLNAQYIHTAQDAASIPHLIIQLNQALSQIGQAKDQIVAAFLLTSPDRDICWSRTRPIGTAFSDDPPPYDSPRVIFLNGNDPLHKDWFVEYHSDELANYRTNTTLLALQTMCKHHGIRDYYAWSMETTSLWPEIDVSRFYKNGKKNLQGDIEYKRGRHPNQVQHQRICDIFHTMILQDQSY